MNTALWIAQGLLAAVFLGSGLMKMSRSYEALTADPRMGWAHDFSPGFIKLIAGAETLGAVGLIVPALTGIAPVLTPVAAAGLFVIMLGAAATHLRRSETPMAAVTVVLAGLAGFVAYGRLLAHPL